MKIEFIEHIFFDLDHTLWDFDKNSSLAYEKMFEKYKILIPVKNFLEVYQPINMSYWKLYREDKIEKLELRRGRLMDTFKRFDVSIPLDVIDRLSDDYIKYLPDNNYLIDGAISLLEYLYPKYQLHIITNGFSEVQHRKLSNSKISHYFKTITDSEKVGVKKPNPIIFKEALSLTGADATKSIMIGDNFEADIMGAESIGIRTICFNYHKENIPNNFIQVSKLSAIKNYL